METIQEIDHVAGRRAEGATCPGPASASGEEHGVMRNLPVPVSTPSAVNGATQAHLDPASQHEAQLEHAAQHPAPVKEPARRKKASKSAAKLKQSKLDMRREQFLAKVSVNASKSVPLPAGSPEAQPRRAGSRPWPGTRGEKPTGQEGLGGEGLEAEEAHEEAKLPAGAWSSCVEKLPVDHANGSSTCSDSTCSEDGNFGSVTTDEDDDYYESLVAGVSTLHVAAPVGANPSVLELKGGSEEGQHAEWGDDAANDHVAEEGLKTMKRRDPSKVKGRGREAALTSEGNDEQLRGTLRPPIGAKGAVPQASRDRECKTEPAESADDIMQDEVEEDWEAAAEQFTKKVGKKCSLNKLHAECGPAAKEDGTGPIGLHSALSTKNCATGAAADTPNASYSRPNQQDLNRAQGMPQRLAPNGLRPGYAYTGTVLNRARSMNIGRAWRPDDMSRPLTLPPALSQRSIWMGVDLAGGATWRDAQGGPQLPKLSHWPTPQSHSQRDEQQPPLPPCCPICAEDLDMTDSSFFPCPCGFRLCLFCYHRIAADDGRCPGCRKEYSGDAANHMPKSSVLPLR